MAARSWQALRAHGTCGEGIPPQVYWEQGQDWWHFYWQLPGLSGRSSREAAPTAPPLRSWGLWEGDVVELFLALAPSSPWYTQPGCYWEWQLAPNGASFALVIGQPRRLYATPLAIPGEWRSFFRPDGWEVHLKLKASHFTGRGNLHVCWRRPQQLYSLSPGPDGVADFHRPEFFVELFSSMKS